VKRILVDVNVVLDVLLDRAPHSAASAAVWAAIESGAAAGLLAAHAVTTVHYLLRQNLGMARSRQAVAAVLRVFDVATVDAQVLRAALNSPSRDFEDAVTAAAAQWAGCDYIVTRDPKGFRESPVPALTPESAAALLRR
jgi:predicted nucleic acid-binding protein